MLTFYSNDLSSKPTLVYSFNSAKLFEKNENKRKRRRLELIFEKYSKILRKYFLLAFKLKLFF